VLRANMKYVGPFRPASGGGLETNPNAEWNATTGRQLYITDPDSLADDDSDIGYSGVINYINKFGANGYKSYDPISELYYECLNYYKNRGPTAEYSSGLTAAMKDNFPVINQAPDTSYTEISSNFRWIDPIQHQCQKNYIVGINDANPWLDKSLPGTSWTSSSFTNSNGTFTLQGSDYGEPSNPDTDIDVTSLTNTVGVLEGLDGTSQCVGGDSSTFNNSATNKTIDGLGTVMGTCPYVPKENSYYIAGLAYYAHTNDLRSDASLPGDQTVTTFMVDTQEYNNTPLVGDMNMLWLAGKYGGFKESDYTDSNGDGNDREPNLTSEWDKDGDGEPDNYVLASSPEKLVDGLKNQFADIAAVRNAGAAAAVIANSTDRTGIRMQAMYQPQLSNGTQTVEWVGYLQGLFLDSKGFLREDGDEDNQLDSIDTDPIIQLLYNETPSTGQPRTQVYYCNGTDPVGGTPVDCSNMSDYRIKEFEDLKPVWAAERVLSDLNNSAIPTQRSYSSPVDPSSNTNGRYIFTWLDDGDEFVESGETVDFTDSTFGSSNYYWLDIQNSSDTNGDSTIDATDADNIVDYIRGQEDISGTNMRSRTLGIGASAVTHRLGDMIHSSPVAVDVPNGNWDTLYGDVTYSAFRSEYANRRQMIYVGGNDGMVHAFNGGFYDPSTSKFYKTSNAGTGSETAHVLGAEMWAYVPKNLLPHLQWLTRDDYPHVYYVDGDLKIMDVNIFTSTGATGEHPYGWGTILVATMRFGGNPITYDHDNNPSTPDITARSAVMVFDITDPENPPKLLGEFTDDELGFTTSTPELLFHRAPNSSDYLWTSTPSVNDWALAFGSGPNVFNNATASASKDPYVYIMNLTLDSTEGTLKIDPTGANFGIYNPGMIDVADGSVVGSVATIAGADSSDTGSFVGHPQATDWDYDYRTDTLYFGLVTGDNLSSQTGKLKRLNMPVTTTDWAFSDVVDPGQPFPNKPVTLRDYQGNKWVYAGTGRLYVRDDNLSTTQQSYYGVKEIFDSSTGLPDGTTVNRSGSNSLQDVSGYVSDSAGNLTATGTNALPGGVSTVSQLETHIAQSSVYGWFRDFENSTGNERNITNTTFHRDFLVFTTYMPPTSACDAVGHSFLNCLYYKTGTNIPGAGCFEPTSRIDGTPVGDSQVQIDLGNTLAFQPGVGAGGDLDHSDNRGQRLRTPFKPKTQPGGRQSWREIILE
jgi:type IV pilus assembly protein PilY1